jgi:hypothetical protein
MAAVAMGGALRDPRWLAAGAGGLLAAVAALWAMRGLPGGAALFWLTPFPLFAAGLAFGLPALAGAVALAGFAIALLGGTVPLVFYLVGFGAPVFLLVALGLRGGQIATGLPLAVLGLWPALVLLIAALAFAGAPGGLESVLRRVVEVALARMGMPAAEAVVDELVRVKAAAIGFWLAIALAANGAAAQGFLARRGLAAAATPAWSAVRLPGWYPLLPAVAAGLWAAAPEEGDAVQLSLLLLLLMPVFLQGVAAVHRRLRGRPGRPAILAGFYAVLVLFSVPAAVAVTALGLIEQWRRPAPSGGKT